MHLARGEAGSLDQLRRPCFIRHPRHKEEAKHTYTHEMVNVY